MAENRCAATVLKDFEKLKISSKKVLTKGLVFAIIINVVARTANELSETTATILENDTEKSHFVQENDTGAPEGATIVSTVRFLMSETLLENDGR